MQPDIVLTMPASFIVRLLLITHMHLVARCQSADWSDLAMARPCSQMLAADLIYYYSSMGQTVLSSAAAACLSDDTSEAVATRLVSVLTARMGSMPPVAFLSFLATLLAGQAQDVAASWPRHVALITACIQSLQCIGDSGTAVSLEVLLPDMMSCINTSALRGHWPL